MTFRHLGTEIERPAEQVSALVRDYATLPRWAQGLSSGIEQDGGVWFTESPMGRVTVEFCADNPWGVCDHDVTLPDGTVVTNPVRVIPDGDRCQVVFTVRSSGAADVDADAAHVEADLARLKELAESL